MRPFGDVMTGFASVYDECSSDIFNDCEIDATCAPNNCCTCCSDGFGVVGVVVVRAFCKSGIRYVLKNDVDRVVNMVYGLRCVIGADNGAYVGIT